MGRNENYDFLDELFEKHLNDDSTNVMDFERIVRDSLQDEARRSSSDTGKKQPSAASARAKSDFAGSSASEGKEKSSLTRYGCFVKRVSSMTYMNRQRGYYRRGHEEAIAKYLSQAEMNRNNLSLVEKNLEYELSRFYTQQTARDKYSEGYYDGLKFVQRALVYSREIMMRSVAVTLRRALNERK